MKATLLDPSGVPFVPQHQGGDHDGIGGGEAAIPADDETCAGRRRALCDLLGVPTPRLCTSGEVVRELERLGFVDRQGSPPGFLTTLPRGVAFSRAVEALNDAHVAALNAARIDLPLVFDGSSPDLESLTEPYERQGRVFHIANGDPGLRLAYAADPALFSWLRARDLDPGRLPYAIYSPAPAFRLWRSGELGLRAQRQYTLPDLHVICLRDDARRVFLSLVREAAGVARRLFGESFVQFLEHTDDFGRTQRGLASDVAVSGGQFTVVRTLPEQAKYFALKGGINVDMGSGSLMLFNLQWDDENSARFGFRAAGAAVTVLHATVSGALTKVLPAIVGRGLAGLGPRVIPIALAPVQVTVFPLREEHVSVAAAAVAALLARGLRAELGPHAGRMAGRIRASRHDWVPFHAVVGDAEAGGAPLRLRSPASEGDLGVEEVVGRAEALAPSAPLAARATRLDSPFTR